MADELIIGNLNITDKKILDIIFSALSTSDTLFNADRKTEFSFFINDSNIQSAEVVSVEQSLFSNNLQMVDSKMPEILSYLILLSKAEKENGIEKLLNLLLEKNPIGFDVNYKKIFYTKKVTDFLTECALGLND